MTWSNKWLYTPPAAATDAFAGKVIASADWNSIFTDMSNAFTQIGQQFVVTTGINFNATNTDTSIAIPLPTGFTHYVIDSIRIVDASASISTATCGVFTAASGGGTPIVTSGSSITITTASANTNNNAQSLTVNNASTLAYNLANVFFRVQNPEGSAATATVIIHIVPLP